MVARSAGLDLLTAALGFWIYHNFIANFLATRTETSSPLPQDAPHPARTCNLLHAIPGGRGVSEAVLGLPMKETLDFRALHAGSPSGILAHPFSGPTMLRI